MDIIAHRGFWDHPSEKNTPKAFRKAFENDFGVETDFRDSQGQLMISHDIPMSMDSSVSQFIKLYAQNPVAAPIAINIKSDGLQDLIFNLLQEANFRSSFVFDMSVPDMRGYFSKGIPVYSRLSDQETPAFLDQADGIWFDAFQNELLSVELVEQYLSKSKKITFVSSELHGRNYSDLWKFIRNEKLHQRADISICTDLPGDARQFFSL
jgi:glycerophosphoryl diester phosphodiesterase